MDDGAKKQMRAVIAVIAVIVGIGAAIFSGIRSLDNGPHVVGSLGGNPQGAPPPGSQTAADPATGGKAASDKN